MFFHQMEGIKGKNLASSVVSLRFSVYVCVCACAVCKSSYVGILCKQCVKMYCLFDMVLSLNLTSTAMSLAPVNCDQVFVCLCESD